MDLRSGNLPFTVPRMGTKAAMIPINLPLTVEGAIPRLWQVRTTMDDAKVNQL